VEVESDLLNPGSHPIQRTVEVAPVSDIITPVHVDAASILDVGFSASNTLQVKQETSYRVTFAAVCDRIVGIVSRALAAVGITVSCENEVGSYATRWTDDRVAQSFNWTDDRVTT
jgi:hypothetical protein